MAKDKKLFEQLENFRKEYLDKADNRFNYDTFFKNSFETQVYYEVTQNKLFISERLGFIYNLRFCLGLISPDSPASQNFDMILRYTLNSYTKEQMCYYLSIIIEWINEYESNNWQCNYENLFKGELNYLQKENLKKLKNLITLSLFHLEKSPILSRDFKGNESLYSVDLDIIALHENQMKLIKGITNFLIENPNKHINETIMDESNYEKLINYITDVQRNNRFNDYGNIKLSVNLSRSEIYYTIYLVSQILENNIINNKIVLKNLSSPFRSMNIILQFEIFEAQKKELGVFIDSTLIELKTKLSGSTIQKKFSTSPKGYKKLNKYSANVVVK